MRAVTAPGFLKSSGVRRSIGRSSVITLNRTPHQKGTRYRSVLSSGASLKKGNTCLNAHRHIAYAMNKAGRNTPNASDTGGGTPRVSLKKVMCQCPMVTIDQNNTSGDGRNIANSDTVTKILNARAGLRRSLQFSSVDVERKR